MDNTNGTSVKNDKYYADAFPEITVSKTTAYEGGAGRVHTTLEKALDDKLQNTLAGKWLASRGNAHSSLNIPFSTIVEDATDNLDVYKMIVALAEWRRANVA